MNDPSSWESVLIHDVYYKVTRRLVLSFSRRAVLSAILLARAKVTKSGLIFMGASITRHPFPVAVRGPLMFAVTWQ